MKKSLILGLDIGGANTKAALLKFNEANIISTYSHIEYFPFWEKSIENLKTLFHNIIKYLIVDHGFDLEDVDYIPITLTAELSDAFQTKKEGILTILNTLSDVFNKEKLYFITIESKYIKFEIAKSNPLKLAAANWASTALFLGLYKPNCVLIDAGSTTIDLIHIFDSYPDTKGKTDIERLINHELIYTGGLRATIPSITHFVPYKGNFIRISFEKFALVSDVHRILNNITENEYINDTADNRTKSLNNCYARLARMVCADLDMISIKELNKIAQYIYQKQKELIKTEIAKFLQDLNLSKYDYDDKQIEFIITGLSADFLIKPVLKDLGYKKIKNYEDITKIPDYISSSAYAVAGAFYFKYLNLNKNE